MRNSPSPRWGGLGRGGLSAKGTPYERRHPHPTLPHRGGGLRYRPRPPRAADEARHRFPRLRGRDARRGDELDFGAQPRLRALQCRRVRGDRLRGDDARPARHRDRRDEEAHAKAVRRQPHHHAPDDLRADRRLRAARSHPRRPRRRPAAARRDRPDQGQWRQIDLLRPGAGAGEEADPLGRRRAGDRGDGGGRPYRPGLDLGARPGDIAAARRRAADLRRRRHRPWRADRRLSGDGRGRRPIGHPLRLRATNASPIPISRRRSSAPRRATRSPRSRSTRGCR